LLDYSKLKGKCGIFEYRDVCGGQRGRAYGITGDYMETDPAFAYETKGKIG
jgi:MoaA/NifB/PqqE/SkfB family radical SAM enzyme